MLHHTATHQLPTPARGRSWHWLVGRDGVLYRDVDERDVAHHCGLTDRWRPPWVGASPIAVSDINWCSIGVEIMCAPQDGEGYTDEQYVAVRRLMAHLYETFGSIPFVGHGEVDSTKWETEPHGFDWGRAGFGPRTAQGRWWRPQEEGEDMGRILELEEQLRVVTGERDQLNGVATDLGHQLDNCQALKTQVEHELTQRVAALQAQLQEAQGKDAELDVLRADVARLQDLASELSDQLERLGSPRLVTRVALAFSDGATQDVVVPPAQEQPQRVEQGV